MIRHPGRHHRLNRNNHSLNLSRPMRRCLHAPEGPDRHPLDRRLLILLVLELRRRINRRPAIKLIHLLLTRMILCLWRYRRPVVQPDVEPRHLPRHHRQLRFSSPIDIDSHSPASQPLEISREYPWRIYLESYQVILIEISVFLVIPEVRVIH